MIAVNMALGPTIVLHSGATFDFLDPTASEFTIDDVAHGLAHTCRYAGQCRSFYSVAEHSLHVSNVAEGFELEALMHDASEAFIGDVTRPLKQLLPQYKLIESAVQKAVFARFGLQAHLSKKIKQADLQVLAAEQSQVMPLGTDAWARKEGIKPAEIIVVILYLDQEGRGNGLSNKIKAYRLQADGLDTYDADEILGFGHDQRRFDFAAKMLTQLGITRVRLMTNNPLKIAALEAAGVELVSSERIHGRLTRENAGYLAAKRDRAGHRIDATLVTPPGHTSE